jgi:hypothetical protein
MIKIPANIYVGGRNDLRNPWDTVMDEEVQRDLSP